ncbi:hypothetical protein [Janibacter melonis]|uniref:hypothetical protein n=1 Tax=Janibacter melonis TaxID=262209 RepID=UPI002096171D|nr:hypothetical protein [Janibacter melonis]
MVRADETDGAHPLLAPMEMRGRTMSGWYETAADAEIVDDVLAELAEMGLRRVATLPPKGWRAPLAPLSKSCPGFARVPDSCEVGVYRVTRETWGG